MIKPFFFLLFLLILKPIIAQDIIKVGDYSFQIGESSESFLSKYPDYLKDEFKDENYPNDVTQYRYDHPSKDINFTVRFYKNSLYYIYIDDPYWSGLMSTIDPEKIGFTKTGEYVDPSGNTYFADLITEYYQKGDIKLELSTTRLGYLLIEKSITK